ncbi:MAG: ATP-dependent DNA ligase [Candidatus Thermoplasmatota archaeon]|nr:ATP-dependent DNA ligase [Candidatus Thermoplasmatota archaeon]MCL5789490.1 ATP-dependent DNA ligase [Candidatus Thermoplasmatota archaeon]
MRFLALAETLDRIESTTKRLEMVDLISKLLQVAEDDIRETVFLLQGKIAPDYEGIELGMAEKIAIRALSSLSGLREEAIESELVKKGDLGKIGEELLKSKKQASLFSEELTVRKVYESLVKIARTGGGGSQTRKLQLILDLLHSAEPLEVRYLLRIVTGKMRIGVADMTIVDSIAVAFGSKERSDDVERAYNIMPNLPELAYRAMAGGIDSLSTIRITPGIPIRSMLAERLPSLSEILDRMDGKFAIEYKYDGLRTQVHKMGTKVELFSRRLENITAQFPDIVKEIIENVKVDNAILDGEAVPYNMASNEMLPFQEISRRRGRKYDLNETIERIPVVLFLFDAMMLNGKSLMEIPYAERRLRLINSVKESSKIKVAKSRVVTDVESADKFFNEALEAGCEGIMAKSIEDKSVYKPGAREFLWIKYKREYQLEMEDTVDLVVVGAFGGQGKRSGGYGALLMAVYSEEEDMFKTICKLGSGFSDEQLESLPRMLKPYSISARDPRVESTMEADYWFSPSLVLEVKGAEITLSPTHTCCADVVRKGAGLAIRFPRFTGKWRSDKKAEDATNEGEILEMYHSQRKKILADNP